MHQSTNILTLTLLSSMMIACGNPIKERSHVVAPASLVMSNMAADSTRKMIAAAAYTAAMPSPESVRLEQNTEKYQKNEVNPIYRVADQAVSTFSIDVDTGSYSNTRRFLNDGRLPPIDAVRAEEMINYFDYQYPQPNSIHPFSVTTEIVDSPWKENAKLIKIGIQAKDLATKQLPPANLVFLVDVSGSMDAPDKLPLVKQTLRLLTEQLRPQDKVTIITYASGEKLLLEPTSGDQKDKILRVIDALQASGATAGEQAIQLAYQQAEKAMLKNGINRILLATDGDFNVGITDFSTLKGMVAEKRKSGISLTTLGFGTGNYNEQLMEQLADAGDGNYSYIDNKNEAKKVVQRQLSSTLATVAQDVKIQVEFNPATVKEYRLVGYENRMLKQEDFNNDKVDAGDIGAGHNVTAIYEIIPVGQQGWLNDSRYQASTKTDTTKKSEYAFVNLRYKLPNQEKSILLNQAVKAQSKSLAQANSDTRFAIAVASYAQQLKGGQYNAAMGWDQIIQLAQQSAKPDPYQMREEFIELAKIAKSLSAKKD
ncbi:vWA domain-containing protein [Acinetobacter sp. WCHA39]|uniref:vWA domain-containing protein n=1 Tax=Acinetobacter sp. WCHA39 TaxID=2004648 RepID=UPI000B3D4B92|nr:VWA domain-containing protein [Acinetobacter sp. WCHA39]AZM40032.1 VWA domain-containing protein [Acinetobacter baumannii]